MSEELKEIADREHALFLSVKDCIYDEISKRFHAREPVHNGWLTYLNEVKDVVQKVKMTQVNKYMPLALLSIKEPK